MSCNIDAHRICHLEGRELPIADFMHVLIHPKMYVCTLVHLLGTTEEDLSGCMIVDYNQRARHPEWCLPEGSGTVAICGLREQGSMVVVGVGAGMLGSCHFPNRKVQKSEPPFP